MAINGADSPARRQANLGARAMIGFVVVIVALAAGMGVSLRRLAGVASRQVERIRAEEDEITLTENLRWTGELMISAGRGYLLTGQAVFVSRLDEARGLFQQNIRALHESTLLPRGSRLLADVESTGTTFASRQDAFVEARKRPGVDLQQLADRFEAELLPLRRELEGALDRLVDQKQVAIGRAYEEATRARSRLLATLYAALGIIVALGLGIGGFFSRQIDHAHRKEAKALGEARRAVAGRDEVMAILAHDLRNPLSAITMKAAMLRKYAESEKTKTQAQSIENVALRMEYLIRSLLDASTMEAGRFSVTPAACDVEELLVEVLEMFETSSSSKGVSLCRDVKDHGLVIRAERGRVVQVLSNLLGNALKFTPQGGRVTLSVERQGRMARFSVLDTGPGIARENATRIFDRYWKKDTPETSGTGLGLFIAKGIVDAHGGQIGVEDGVGQGARFYFTLPLAGRAEARAPEPEAGQSLHPA